MEKMKEKQTKQKKKEKQLKDSKLSTPESSNSQTNQFANLQTNRSSNSQTNQSPNAQTNESSQVTSEVPASSPKSSFCWRCVSTIFWMIVIGSTATYAFVVLFFQYEQTQTCVGDWGTWSPPMPQKNGKGVCHFTFELKIRGRNQPIISWDSWYDGLWKDGKKHGKGTYVSFAFNQFEGDWVEDLRDGEGIYKFADGTRYIGHWTQDRFTGASNKLFLSLIRLDKYSTECMQHLNGSLFVGHTSNGLPHGRGTVYFPMIASSPHLLKSVNLDVFSVVEGRFENGCLMGSDGQVKMQDGTMFWVEDARQHFDMDGFGSFNGSIVVRPKREAEEVYRFDGSRLVLPDGKVLDESKKAANFSRQMVDLFESLQCLKWFEFHFLEMRKWVESEIYLFDHVDKDKDVIANLGKEL
jgi:hypothetical protein